MKNKFLFLLIILFGLGVSFQALALELTWPTSPFGTPLTDNSTLTDMVRYFYEWGIFIGGIAVFIALLIGGFLFLTSAGDPGRMKDAKDRIFSALIGLVLLFSIYLILNTINPELTVLTTPTVSPPESTLSIECDTNADCPVNYECKNDPNPGDGTKDGTCLLSISISTAPCEKAILYTDPDYVTVNTEITSGTGCTDLTNTTVKSIKYNPDKSRCTTYLYSDVGCGSDPRLIISADTPNLETTYKITEFMSVDVLTQ